MSVSNKDKLTIFFVSLSLILLLLLSAFLIYENYSREKIFLTGKILCTQIMNAEITYYRENGKYLINDKVSFNDYYPLDARTNPYFSVFSTYPIDENKQGLTVFGSLSMEKYKLNVVFDNNSETKTLKTIDVKIVKNK